MSLDGVIQLDGLMQSLSPTDVPFKHTGWELDDFDGGPGVADSTTDPSWNATVLGDDWPEEVARLRKELDGEILVYGSRRLSRALIGPGLVDELRLLVYPLVLGAGGRLFGGTQDQIPLGMVEARPLGGGVVNMIYAPTHYGRVMRTLENVVVTQHHNA